MSKMPWEPTATIAVLKERAAFLSAIRHFFDKRLVMEVDTPVLSRSVSTAPHLHSFAVSTNKAQECLRYLQTSPEYGMKRLLAAGSGPIYYLGKAFRKGEIGARHNPEFTLLEWYRPKWDHLELAKEVDTLFGYLLGSEPAEQVTYAALFEQFLGIDPHLCAIEVLQDLCIKKDWVSAISLPVMDKDGWLDLVMTHAIEPHLGQSRPTIVIDFPASQASLARTRSNGTYEVAERFEFYYRGLELANGYHELQCTLTLERRFQEDLIKRQKAGLEALPIDHQLLTAMASGLPDCAGVAVGVDRLLMLKLGNPNIANVLPFAWENA